MNKFLLSIFLTAAIIFPINLYSTQTSFQISTPPIPWYEFQKGQEDMKVSATGLYLTGKIENEEEPAAGGDVSVTGGSGGCYYRYAFRDEFAVDAGGMALWAGGDVGNAAAMNMGLVSVPFGLEYLAMRTDNTAVIIYAGMNFTWLTLGIDIDTGTETGSLDILTSMRGPQAVIQAAFKFTDFVITPFFMVTRLSGSATIDYEGGGESGSISTGIPSSTSFSYGLDIIYTPMELTLSSIIQQSMANDENNGMRTYIVTLNYHFNLTEGDKNKEKKETVSPKKVKPVRKTGQAGIK
jgi:hypothetical protein